MLISHVDLRVTDRARAEAFYGPLLALLGTDSQRTDDWTTFGIPSERDRHWFGLTEDPAMAPGLTRIAFTAASREIVDRAAAQLRTLGARKIEGPDASEGYYAVFFEDPDGNRLEICVPE